MTTLRPNSPHSVHASQRIMHPGCIDRSVWAMHSGAFTLESALERALVGSSEIHAVLPQRRWQQPRRLHAAHTGSGTSCGEPQRHLGTLVAADMLDLPQFVLAAPPWWVLLPALSPPLPSPLSSLSSLLL